MWTWGYITQQIVVMGLWFFAIWALQETFREICQDEKRAKRMKDGVSR